MTRDEEDKRDFYRCKQALAAKGLMNPLTPEEEADLDRLNALHEKREQERKDRRSMAAAGSIGGPK